MNVSIPMQNSSALISASCQRFGLHRAVGKRVVAHVEAHADRIRLVGFQALEHQVDLRVEDHVAVCRILIKTDHLLEDLVGDAFLVAEAKFVMTRVGAGHQLAAGAVEVAR